MKYLIFDVGASNGRVILMEFDGSKFVMEEIYRFNNRPVYAAGTLYWDILRLFSEIKTGIQLAVRKHKKISSIGIDTWAGDFGLIDQKGKLISNPIHYRDEKRNDIFKKFYDIIPKEKLYDLTGALLLSTVSVFHLYSLKIQNATELVNAYRFLMIPDIFNYFLTGKVSNEFTNATTTAIYNQKEKKWEDRILKKIGISKDIFPRMIMPGDKIGNISNEICRELEIEPIPVIAPATHDTASAVAGIPIKNEKENWAFISMGTWCVVGKETENPIISRKAMEAGFVNEGGADGSNIFFKNITGLWIIQQCREKWMIDKGDNISWNEINNISNTAKPFKSFINVDDPVFFHKHLSMPETIQEYCRSKSQDVPESIGEIARCIYESLVLRFKFNLDILEQLTSKKIDLLCLVGGGNKNRVLCKWIANATGITTILGSAEATAIGNFLMQLKSTGEIKTLNEGRNIVVDSSEMIIYEPEEKERWNEEYSRYLKIL